MLAEEVQVIGRVENMMPKSIYQLLPYFYISLGLLCPLFVESNLIFFSSALLIAVGSVVLWMRHTNMVDPVEYIKADNNLSDDESDLFLDDNANLPDHERRFGDERAFPLVDDNGVMIPFDRRSKKSDKTD